MNPGALDGVDRDYAGGMDDDYADDSDLPPSQLPTASQAANLGTQLVALKAGVQIQRLAFTRVAKRVDVHKLKQAIWEEIEPSPKKPSATRQQQDAIPSFSQLLGGLDRTSYPKESLKDVSVSYCFICLLHLANEHGLSIQPDGTDLVVQAPA